MQLTPVARAPLTFGQLSVWRSIQHLPPDAGNLSQVWTLPDRTGIAAVEQALAVLELRHESLRTRYERADGSDLVQVVWPAAPVHLDTVDGSENPARAAAEAAERVAAEPFVLTRDRPWRARVITTAGAPARLVICLHHIAADAWAVKQLRQEFLDLVDGRGPAGPAPSCRELAVEQWSPARGNRRAAARTFWDGVLRAAPPLEREPGTDGSGMSGALSTRWARLASAEAAWAAGRIADRLKVSPHTVVLAAFCLALHHHTGRDRILVAVYTSNRNDPRWDTLVATQSQIIPLLVVPEPGEDFGTLARRVHWECLRAYRHGSYNVDDVVELGAAHGYTGSVNGSFEGSVGGFFRYFFNYLGENQQEHPSMDPEIRTGTDGRHIGAPVHLVVRTGAALTCKLRTSTAGTGFEEVITPLTRMRDILLDAAGPR